MFLLFVIADFLRSGSHIFSTWNYCQVLSRLAFVWVSLQRDVYLFTKVPVFYYCVILLVRPQICDAYIIFDVITDLLVSICSSLLAFLSSLLGAWFCKIDRFFEYFCLVDYYSKSSVLSLVSLLLYVFFTFAFLLQWSSSQLLRPYTILLTIFSNRSWLIGICWLQYCRLLRTLLAIIPALFSYKLACAFFS